MLNLQLKAVHNLDMKELKIQLKAQFTVDVTVNEQFLTIMNSNEKMN